MPLSTVFLIWIGLILGKAIGFPVIKHIPWIAIIFTPVGWLLYVIFRPLFYFAFFFAFMWLLVWMWGLV